LDAYIRIPIPSSKSACMMTAPTPPLKATTEIEPGSGYVKVKLQ
jgi:hypothetical protein